jgi:hypothetical protein
MRSRSLTLARLLAASLLARLLAVSLLACLPALSLVACTSDRSIYLPPDGGPWEYPVTLEPMSASARVERLAAFQARNPDVCAAIDEFGRCTYTPECPLTSGEGVPDSAAAARVARDFLERNRDFFHLTGDLPRVQSVRRYADGRWWLWFAPQEVAGIEVFGTSIVVELRREVTRVDGGHYPELRVPSSPRISEEEARAQLPAEIDYPCWTTIHAVLRPDPVMIGFPLRLGPHDSPTRMELRTAYRFSYEGSPSMVIQDVYVDVMTGERIASINHVIC